jgi:hypothetical protein
VTNRAELLHTVKAMLIIAAVAVCITAITVGVFKLNRWGSNEAPIIIYHR